MVVQKGRMFIFHGLPPVGISKSISAGPRYGRQSLRMKCEARLSIPGLPVGFHAMGVGNRWDGNSSCGKWGILLDKAWWRWNHVGASRRRPCRGLCR